MTEKFDKLFACTFEASIVKTFCKIFVLDYFYHHIKYFPVIETSYEV